MCCCIDIAQKTANLASQKFIQRQIIRYDESFGLRRTR